MASDQAEQLHRYINTMLNLFLVNEQSFPSAKGRMRYNPLDFQTLRFVAAQPDCRGSDIARALGVVPTTLQSALDPAAMSHESATPLELQSNTYEVSSAPISTRQC